MSYDNGGSFKSGSLEDNIVSYSFKFKVKAMTFVVSCSQLPGFAKSMISDMGCTSACCEYVYFSPLVNKKLT